MKKINMGSSKTSSFGRFLRGKGFYAALCLSLVAVGAAVYVAYDQTANSLEGQLESLSSVTSQAEVWGYDDLNENANAAKIGVEKETAPETEAVTAEPEETEAMVQASTQPLIMPLNGEVIQPFSNGELVKSSTLNTWKTHDGIDIKGTLGDPIKSMTSGTVTEVKEDPMWGVCVIVDHGNGLEGHYYNLNKVSPVQVGQKVSAGTVIGAIGDTAQAEVSQPSHLHFGVKKNSSWVDPLALINGNQ